MESSRSYNPNNPVTTSSSAFTSATSPTSQLDPINDTVNTCTRGPLTPEPDSAFQQIISERVAKQLEELSCRAAFDAHWYADTEVQAEVSRMSHAPFRDMFRGRPRTRSSSPAKPVGLTRSKRTSSSDSKRDRLERSRAGYESSTQNTVPLSSSTCGPAPMGSMNGINKNYNLTASPQPLIWGSEVDIQIISISQPARPATSPVQGVSAIHPDDHYHSINNDKDSEYQLTSKTPPTAEGTEHGNKFPWLLNEARQKARIAKSITTMTSPINGSRGTTNAMNQNKYPWLIEDARRKAGITTSSNGNRIISSSSSSDEKVKPRKRKREVEVEIDTMYQYGHYPYDSCLDRSGGQRPVGDRSGEEEIGVRNARKHEDGEESEGSVGMSVRREVDADADADADMYDSMGWNMDVDAGNDADDEESIV